ncbi:MAG: quinone oxidoreductase [Alphaproteobacteria bacterium]|nr:MAG: quinone oxidoreductase [Alphaproteobacteria bacterium]
MKIKSVRIHETGGPEVLKLEEVELADPAPHEVRVRHTAIGLNFIDTYHRTGLYPLQLPSGLGSEAAGVVEAVGADVKHLKEGDRVAFAGAAFPTYAEASNANAARVSKLPDNISEEVAAAMMLKGMTAQFLLRSCYQVKPGETILFHAAAGGVGTIATQWAASLGAEVIGTVGSEAKAKLALGNGCAHIIFYDKEDVPARVKEITGGKGVPVVYDSVGKSTFLGSLDSLQPRGLLVSYGNASGPVTDVNLGILAQKGSLYVTRPTLFHYIASQEDFETCTRELFEVVGSGKVKVEIGQRYKLDDVAQAHADLEGRNTIGATVIVP